MQVRRLSSEEQWAPFLQLRKRKDHFIFTVESTGEIASIQRPPNLLRSQRAQSPPQTIFFMQRAFSLSILDNALCLTSHDCFIGDAAVGVEVTHAARDGSAIDLMLPL